MEMKRGISVLLALALFPLAAAAVPTEIDLAQEGRKINLGKSMELFQPAGGSTFSVDLLPLESFRPIGRRTPNFGPNKNPVWLWGRLKNSGDLPLDRILVVGSDYLHCQGLLAPKGNPSGPSLPLERWRPEDWQLLERFTLPAHSELDLFLRCQTDIFLGFRLILASEEGYWRQELLEGGVQAFYYGALSIILLYNLFLYLSLRERGYLY